MKVLEFVKLADWAKLKTAFTDQSNVHTTCLSGRSPLIHVKAAPSLRHHSSTANVEEKGSSISHSLNPKPKPGCRIYFQSRGRRKKKKITVAVKQRNCPLCSWHRSGRILAPLQSRSFSELRRGTGNGAAAALDKHASY